VVVFVRLGIHCGRYTGLQESTTITIVKTVIEGKWTYDGKQVIADEACDQISTLLQACAHVGARDGGWTQLYRDANGGVFWELTYPRGEMHGGGPPRLESYSPDEVRARYPDLDIGR
jgi:hypothetical protein